MFDAFFDAIAGLLAWYYELPVVGDSYGWAIALLTLTVMVIVTPLTLKGTRSMMAMQALAPEMKRIQQEYADDRVKMNEEMLAFYRENNINPIGGCLPLLLQMPVFILLYQVIRGLTQRGEDGFFDPKYLSESSELYQRLHGSEEMVSFGIDLSRSAADALQMAFTEGLPYLGLILVVTATSYIQQKQISGRNPNAEMPQQQKILLRVMPLFFAFISFNFAAALVIYFLVSNLFRIGQQAYISKKIYGVDSIFGAKGAVETTATEKDAESGSDTGAKDSTKGSGTTSTRTGSSKGSSTSKGSSASKGPKRAPAKKTANGQAPKKARPPSGRVTPPKGSSGAAQGRPPQRRKKKKRS